MTDSKVIVISDQEPGLPYSKGLRASQLMVTGLSPFRAYQVAEEVEERLHKRRVGSVTSDELDELTIDVRNESGGARGLPFLALCSARGSLVMYTAASRSVSSGFRPGTVIGSENR